MDLLGCLFLPRACSSLQRKEKEVLRNCKSHVEPVLLLLPGFEKQGSVYLWSLYGKKEKKTEVVHPSCY